jgi:choline dehydrogenase
MRAFDTVILGAGSAGCVLAHRLSADPALRVLLVEAGGSDRSPLIRAPGGLLPIMMSGAYNWGYESVPQKHLQDRVLYLPRGKVLGGSSSTNGMVYCRGTRADFDEWASLGNAGWSFAELLPYFKRAETHELGESSAHGGSGPLRVGRPRVKHPLAVAFVEAGQQSGHPYNDDTNGGRREGFGPTDVTAWKGRRQSTAAAYLRPVRSRPNLSVLTHAHATRVCFEGHRAVGVELCRGATLRRVRAEREVILAAGALNSPQLLMLSGVGDPLHLREHGIEVRVALEGVGRNLHDHLATHVNLRSRVPNSMFKYFGPVQGALAIGRYLAFRSGPLADPGMEAVAFVKSHPSLADTDLKFHFLMALYRNNGRVLIPEHGFGVHINAVKPRSTGRLRLASADPAAPPLVDPGYLSDPRDLEVMRAGIRIAREVFRQRAFDPYRGEELDPGAQAQSDAELDAYVREKSEADYHSVGTCKMGQDALAVVDDRLRVHGAEALRVVDASVMPRIVSGNTNMATIMIAEKASDLILELPPLAAEDLLAGSQSFDARGGAAPSGEGVA